MKKIRKNNFSKLTFCNRIFFVIIFLFFNCNNLNASNFQYTYNNTEKIKISEKTYNRFIEYKKGNFYSQIYQKKFSQTKGMYFSLSKSGNVSVFSFCEDDILGCVSNLVKYQTLKKCERIAKEQCFIIAIGNNLVINKKKISLKDEDYLKKVFKIYISGQKNQTYEIRAMSLREFENGDQYE